MSISEETQLVYNLSCDIKKIKSLMSKEDTIEKIDEDDIIMIIENLEQMFRILILKYEKIIKN